MAVNTLNDIIPVVYAALNKVSREMIGFIPAVYRNSEATQVAIGQSIKYPIVPVFGTAANNTPAAYAPDATGRTIGAGTITINNSKNHSFPLNGEEERELTIGGTKTSILQQTFEQAFRKHANDIEAYLSTVIKNNACQAVGTAGTTPFASNTDLLVDARKILVDNGCPTDDLHCVLDTAAGAKMRKLAVLRKVNEAGDSDLLRRGVLGDLDGFAIGESGNVVKHTAGTANTSYQVNLAAGYAAGKTSIAVDTGSGTILNGDFLSNTQSGVDATKYGVKTALAAGSLEIHNPGLVNPWSDNDTLAISAAYRANACFNRYGVHLVTRLPLLPTGGDAASDVTTAVDPFSGLAFQILLYKQYKQVRIEVAIAYDAFVVQPEYVTILMG